MKAAVAKLNKFEAAIHIALASTGDLPQGLAGIDGQDTTGFISSDNFIKYGLTNADFKEDVGGNAWGFYSCRDTSNFVPFRNGEYFVSYGGQTPGGGPIVIGQDGICVTTVTMTNDIPANAFINMPTRLACNIEAAKDDENNTNGQGRGWNAQLTPAQLGGTNGENYRNCDNYSTGAGIRYAYRVY
jgi:hypothetical protein